MIKQYFILQFNIYGYFQCSVTVFYVIHFKQWISPILLEQRKYLKTVFFPLVTQMINDPPAVQETWVWSLGWEDTLEKGMASHSSIVA